MFNRLIILITTISLIPAFQPALYASEYNLQDPQTYVLQKLKQNDIVFLGTRHKQPPILKFISDLIPKLPNAGVTHIGFEIASDQQAKIDQYMKTGKGLNDIKIHPLIDCTGYRNNLRIIRDIILSKRPVTVALDLPKAEFKGKVSRDEHMAKNITKIFKSNPNAKMLVVVGSNHILKKLEWQDHVPNKHKAIREYIDGIGLNLKMFSIGQVIGKSVFKDDFRERFGGLDGVVALDLDDRFKGWKLGIVENIAIKHTEVWELLDGLIVY